MSIVVGTPLLVCPAGFYGPMYNGDLYTHVEVCFCESPSRTGRMPPVDSETSSRTFAPDLPGGRRYMEIMRFLVGHAYSLRATQRAQSPSHDGIVSECARSELWVQLRDPKRTQLFWLPWRVVVKASSMCEVQTCEGI